MGENMNKYLEISKEVKHLFKEINARKQENYIIENSYFLDDKKVLCMNRSNGVSRFPYGKDGFTLWAYSSGYISINESTFYVVLPADEGKDPYLAFYAGEIVKDKYVPISLLGKGKNPLESDVKRFCVYAKEYVYYLVETKSMRYATRIFVTDDKKVCFDVYAYNKTSKEKEVYLSSYMNCLLKYANGECIETKWFKKCTYQNDTFAFECPEDINRKVHILNFGVIKREFVKNNPYSCQNTTSRKDYFGKTENQLINAESLINGSFKEGKLITHFTDTSIMGDMSHYHLKGHEECIVHYSLGFTHELEEFDNLKKDIYNYAQTNELIKKAITSNNIKAKKMLKISFDNWNNNKISTNVLNTFLDYVLYQTEYCGLAKNSGAMFLGVRDVMQQVEAALMWNPRDCRKKILETLSFIDESGNPPRQYSIPPVGGTPAMDLRDFIDQGVWIINTIYNYLAFTNDYSILKEVIGYYNRVPGGVVLSSTRDNVLAHILRVTNYLITHIDPKTKCLRAMYGDWNDALDGLGITKDEGKEYGDGVSVMASLQLYQVLDQMREILTKIGKHEDLVKQYIAVREDLANGLKEYAIVKNGNDKKIVHGWGDHQSYYVGSFLDSDGESRDSLTANAFYVISGLYKRHYLDKENILKAYKNLDSKYGLRTFNPYFKEDAPGVGRIVNLPKGCAENGATYIHGSLFGVMSLFMLDESKFAYEQIEKLLPITHEILTTSSFVMPNSYSYNLEEGMDGESMSDWYTGSANTLIKTLVRGAFGISVSLDKVIINIRDYFPSKKAKCEITIKGTKFVIDYENNNLKQRTITVNDKKVTNNTLEFDVEDLENNKVIYVQIND